MPTGGQRHTAAGSDTAAGLTWQFWESGSGASMTTFSTPAIGQASTAMGMPAVFATVQLGTRDPKDAKLMPRVVPLALEAS